MSSTARNQVFSAVQTIGSLLPADMLVRISEGKDTTGSTAADYGIVGIGSVRDEAERHWDYLKGAWRVLREKLPQAGNADAAVIPPDPTGLAVNRWLEPLFAELGFGRLQPVPSPGIDCDDKTKTFPISHSWAHVPIHLVPWNTDLDHKPTTRGASTPPQSLVQELLNRTDPHLWAVLSNGRQLRLLRDSASLVGASYVEFDLEAIFDGELFSEFVLLYRLLHVSRFEIEPGTALTTCWLEKWRAEAIDSGTRALEQLRDGVQRAITSLGTGFTQNAKNTALRENLDSDQLKKALLRLVYRMLFVFVAEDRDVLIPHDADPKARERYERYFSTARLRETARRTVGTRHGDRWETLSRVLDHLRQEGGFPALGLPGLGGIFEHNDVDVILGGASLSNEALLAAVRALSVVFDPKAKRNRLIDYRHLGAEELGSIYESLLELVPKYEPADRTFQLIELAGNERKTTGSYYTPASLIDCLLDSALDPVLDKLSGDGPSLEASLLDIKVCDPACGSGHFLVAAARRIAKRLAAVREGNPEPTLDAVRAAMRDVVAKCIYGVDLNPMAVELTKVSLWLEALEPGKPLGFLDAHIKRGNALFGTTPKLLKAGIPDDAFKPIEGDDKKWAAALRKQNEKERGGQDSLFDLAPAIKIGNVEFARSVEKITAAKADALADVHRQEAAFHEWEQSGGYRERKLVSDAWCAAFVWKKTQDGPQAVTETVLNALDSSTPVGIAPETHDEIERITKEYKFFHWHLEFPDVFHVSDGDGGSAGVDERTGWSGGFSCVLGNPPWEQVQLDPREYFASKSSVISSALNMSVRNKMIADLLASDDPIGADYTAELRRNDAFKHFAHQSGRFPLTASGRLNTYALFAEVSYLLVDKHGRMGIIIPTGIATDATTAAFFRSLVETEALDSLLDFVTNPRMWSDIGNRRYRFSIFVALGAAGRVEQTEFWTLAKHPDELPPRGNRIQIPPRDLLTINPNTGTSALFQTQRDADITLAIYRKFPVLINTSNRSSSPWGVQFLLMFMMSSASGLFKTREDLEGEGWHLAGNSFIRTKDRMLPLYEAKLLHHYDHRLSSYDKRPAGSRDTELPRLDLEEKNDPTRVPIPRYWVSEEEVSAQLVSKNWDREWLLGWRDICRATDERTMISSFLPRAAVGHPFPIMLISSTQHACLLNALFSSFTFDYFTRQKIGGVHLTFGYVMQLPVLTPEMLEPQAAFILPRVLELIYTAYDMEPLALDLDDSGGPFRWDEDRRFLLRAELDALFFHLYGINRDDVDYIMETFPIVKRKDIAAHGTYRTKEQILAIYDAIAAATTSGTEYQTILTPAPGFGPRHPVRQAQENR